MVKACQCSCKETKGPKEWKDLIQFRIVELDVLRGIPGRTDVSFTMAETKEGAIKKYYEQNPGASHRILVYPDNCASVYEKPLKPIRPLK